MTEVTSSFSGRAILAKHKSFAMYRPSAVVLAQVLADFPILIAQVCILVLCPDGSVCIGANMCFPGLEIFRSLLSCFPSTS